MSLKTVLVTGFSALAILWTASAFADQQVDNYDVSGWDHDHDGWDHGGHHHDHLVECDSWNNRPNHCYVGHISRVRLHQQLSNGTHHGGSCVQGKEWSYDRDEIYVNFGCRAIFEVERD